MPVANQFCSYRYNADPLTCVYKHACESVCVQVLHDMRQETGVKGLTSRPKGNTILGRYYSKSVYKVNPQCRHYRVAHGDAPEKLTSI